MTTRNITVYCVKGKLGAAGQNWELWHDGVLLYYGLWPIYDDARAMVDKHVYQLDDVLTIGWPDESVTPAAELNSRYWDQVRETDPRGLHRFPWRGMTQDAISSAYGVAKNAIEGQNRVEMPGETESSLGAARRQEIESADFGRDP